LWLQYLLIGFKNLICVTNWSQTSFFILFENEKIQPPLIFRKLERHHCFANPPPAGYHGHFTGFIRLSVDGFQYVEWIGFPTADAQNISFLHA